MYNRTNLQLSNADRCRYIKIYIYIYIYLDIGVMVEWCVWIGWTMVKGIYTCIYIDGDVYICYMNNNIM